MENDFIYNNKISSYHCKSPFTKSILFESSNYDIDLSTKLRGTNLYIIGMMGSGKTTVGDILAKRLNYRFLDTDDLAEYMIEMPISDFFSKGPENIKLFRDVEYQVLMQMSQYTRLVLSTGGGIVERNENWGLLRHGLVVFLDMKPEHIHSRLMSSPEQINKRPLLQSADPLERLQALSDERIDKYMQADLRIEVLPHLSPDEVATNIINGIIEFIERNPPLWKTWKNSRDANAIEAAARINPSATASANVGFGQEKKGSIQYVSMSDIQSGKVKLPNQNSNNNENNENKPFKGFQREK